MALGNKINSNKIAYRSLGLIPTRRAEEMDDLTGKVIFFDRSRNVHRFCNPEPFIFIFRQVGSKLIAFSSQSTPMVLSICFCKRDVQAAAMTH